MPRPLVSILAPALFVFAPFSIPAQELSPVPPTVVSDAAVADPATRADRLFSRGKLKEAAAFYRTALARESEPAVQQRDRFLLACILFELGLHREAKSEFNHVFEDNGAARVSEVLARLCDRRVTQTDESIGNAIEAVIVPSLPRVSQQNVSWNDPVLEGLTAEVLFRTGPLYLDPRDAGALVENNLDDLQILLGASHILRGDQKAGLLEIARRKFPESAPLHLAYYFALKFPERPPSMQPAMEALGAAILRDPENAFPRYLRLGIRDYSIERDPATRMPLPYSSRTLSELEQANKLPRHDAYAEEQTTATRRVLRELGHPFHFQLIQSNFESVSILHNVFQRLAASVQAALEKDDLVEARRIQQIAERVLERWASNGGGTLLNMTAASRSIILAHFSNYYQKRGDLRKVAALKAEQLKHKAQVQEFASNLVWPNIAMIPIPAVSNYAVDNVIRARRDSAP